MTQGIPSWRRTASDMRPTVHGGSQTTVTATSSTPGIACTARRASPRRMSSHDVLVEALRGEIGVELDERFDDIGHWTSGSVSPDFI
jgi:hypothetical protein